MSAYLETSAVLSWILEEAEGQAVQDSIRQTGHLATSELTLAECWRALRRLNEPTIAIQRLLAFQSRWDLVPIHFRLLTQVGQSFPIEPVRTLDAIDLRLAIPELQVVSLDRRVRDNALALGLPVLP